jgi:hypothetical protein
VADGVGGGLGKGDGAQVDVGVQDALGVLGERLGQGATVGAVDPGVAAAALQQLPLDRVIAAEQLQSGVADDRARGQYEDLALGGVQLGSRGVDLGSERVGGALVEAERRRAR